MTQICPKCAHVRSPDNSVGVPDWQCPGCGVAYAKVHEVHARHQGVAIGGISMVDTKRGGARGKWLLWVAVLGGLAWGWSARHHPFANAHAAAEVGAMAATVRADEVLVYTTTECAYCTQAKGWLAQNGFAFTECNMSTTPHCVSEFKALGAQGTPYLVVRGHHLKNGFDSDEFLAALQQTPG